MASEVGATQGIHLGTDNVLQSVEHDSTNTLRTNTLKDSNNLYDLSPQTSSGFAESFLKLFGPPPPPPTTLKPSIEDGLVQVRTKDGYTLRFKGEKEEWTITSPDGKTTRIWGDPHVVEEDGDKWNFHKQSSFIFGKNKITVEVAPAQNKTAVSQTVTIYNGEDRLTVTDIDKNSPRIVNWSLDGSAHDEQLADGIEFVLGKEGNGDDEWVRQE